MKDEIKEKMTIGKAKKILRGFLEKDCYYDTPLYYAIPYLLDYITNLQEENKELKIETEKLTQLWLDSQEKRRKAIDYIDNNSISWDVDYDDNYYEWYTGFEEENIKELLNILQGSDE